MFIFEMEVCEFLRDKGFTVDTQVGCSGFRIDLGLRKADSSDYVLAIECDGATYHSSKNARDRDRLRQEILERMGWRFYRIWSTDWFRNNEVEKENLLKGICFIYGREKVTSVVKDQFDADMRGCEKNGIIRKNGFLYLAGQDDFVMRVPGVKRDIKYIAPEELAAGLHVLLMQNITAEKDGLYKTLANQLGFMRMGDAIYAKLDEALALLDDVVIEGESVSMRHLSN